MKPSKFSYPSFWLVLAIVLVVMGTNATLKYLSGLGKNNSAESEISLHAEQIGLQLSDYPKEIVDLFKYNEETRDFVLDYPLKVVNFKPDSQDLVEHAKCTSPPILMQWDLKWGYMPYNGNVMGISGSAPTALSMAALFVTHDTSLTPVRIAKLAHNMNADDDTDKLLSEGARSLSLEVKGVPKNDKRLREAVAEEGAVVICTTNGKKFSPVIVIRGFDDENRFQLNDTISEKRCKKAYNFADLESSLKKCWKYTLPKKDESQTQETESAESTP